MPHATAPATQKVHITKGELREPKLIGTAWHSHGGENLLSFRHDSWIMGTYTSIVPKQFEKYTVLDRAETNQICGGTFCSHNAIPRHPEPC